MKNAKKIVMGGVAALALVTASVMGTMAYFTSKTATVNNTFTVGDVNITLDETKTDTLGKAETTVKDGETVVVRTDKGNSYKLYPGKTYTKDPTVHVSDDSENCYLFVRVENGLVGAEESGNTSISKQIEANGWTLVPNQTDVYYLGSNGTMTEVEKKTDHTVFGSFTIDSSKSGDDLSVFEEANIKITAGAVQAMGIEADDITTAWNAVAPLTSTTNSNN